MRKEFNKMSYYNSVLQKNCNFATRENKILTNKYGKTMNVQIKNNAKRIKTLLVLTTMTLAGIVFTACNDEKDEDYGDCRECNTEIIVKDTVIYSSDVILEDDEWFVPTYDAVYWVCNPDKYLGYFYAIKSWKETTRAYCVEPCLKINCTIMQKNSNHGVNMPCDLDSPDQFSILIKDIEEFGQPI